MPVPLTTAALGFAAVLLPISELASIIIGSAAVINQALVTYAADLRPPNVEG